MGFRVQKRFGGNKGIGFNLSKSGISPSFRSKSGSISFKGFSVRTGIPGLTFRGGWKTKGYDNFALLLFFLTISLSIFFIKVFILFWVNIVLFSWWIIKTVFKISIFLFSKIKHLVQKNQISTK